MGIAGFLAPNQTGEVMDILLFLVVRRQVTVYSNGLSRVKEPPETPSRLTGEWATARFRKWISEFTASRQLSFFAREGASFA